MKSAKNIHRTLFGSRTGFTTDFEFQSFKGSLSSVPSFKLVDVFTEDIGYTITLSDSKVSAVVSYHKGTVEKPTDIHADEYTREITTMLKFFSSDKLSVKDMTSYYDHEFKWLFLELVDDKGDVTYKFNHHVADVSFFSVQTLLNSYSARIKSDLSGYKNHHLLYLNEKGRLVRTVFPQDIIRLVSCIVLADFDSGYEKTLHIDDESILSTEFVALMLTKVFRSLRDREFVDGVFARVGSDTMDNILKEILDKIVLHHVPSDVIKNIDILGEWGDNYDKIFPSSNKGTEKHPIYIPLNGIDLKLLFSSIKGFVELVVRETPKHLSNDHEYFLVTPNVSFPNESKVVNIGVNTEKFIITLAKDTSDEVLKYIHQFFNRELDGTSLTLSTRRF